MKYYLAPLEGVTNYIYRNAYHKYFSPMDKYFTPFISTNQNISLSTKEIKEILPAHNVGMVTVPQILSNNANDFVKTAQVIRSYGYDTVNLNLGCPSNTVVAKNKGAGFLFHPEQLDRFLDTIFNETQMKISIKTRLGKFDPDEFYALAKIFSQYPMDELIIHPRIQKDMYKNKPRLDVFSQTLGTFKNSVCYNGDIFSVKDFQAIRTLFPAVEHVMLGRGIIGNPALIGQIKTGLTADKAIFRDFHDTLYSAYQEVMFGEKNVLYKMKELWFYMIHMFSDGKKIAKKIKKCEKLSDYDLIINDLFEAHDILSDSPGYRIVADNL